MKGHQVLLVEDDEDLLFLLSKKLEDAGIDFKACETGKSTLEYLAKHKPKLIILDIMLPDIDGLTILKTIATDPDTKDIPVLILSNLDGKAPLEQVSEIGKYEYFVKAKTDYNELIKKVKRKVK